jgi:tetratricopeptide (TPR) repeat protein
VIAAALEDSDSWQQQRRLPEALSAARRADGLLAGVDVDEALRQQVHRRLADQELLDRLENVRLEKQTAVKDGRFDWEGADELYGQAFQDAGLGVENLPVEETAKRFRRSTVAAELAAVLDHWAMVRRNARAADDTSWRHLLRLARLADPDAGRTQVREALQRRDSQALRAVAASEEVFRLPVATLCVLGYAFLAEKDLRGQAEAFLRKAQRRHPDDFWLNHILFMHFRAMQPSQREEAVRFAALAVGLRPASPGAHFNLAAALRDNGKLDEAIAEYREAIAIKGDYAEAHRDLASALSLQGKVDLAIAEYQEAIRINKNDSDVHNYLGCALRSKGQLDQAIKEYRESIRIHNNNAEAHNNLGITLFDVGRLEEAIPEFRKALRLKQDFPEVRSNLGGALLAKGQLNEAIDELRKALEGNKDLFAAHNNLGNALRGKGQLHDAIAEFREALRLKGDYAEARCSLGDALMREGQFHQAVQELRLGHELGSRIPRWPYAARTAQLLRDAERWAKLDARLPAILKGHEHPKDAGERLALAELCQMPCKKCYLAALRFFEQAFAAEPRLTGDQPSFARYNAACAAALAGCGQGKDATGLGAEGRGRLRQQALEWLQADLEAWGRLLQKEPNRARMPIAQRMQHWLADTDFAGVRGPEALAKLSAAERQAWRQLWADVADLLAHSQPQAVPQEKPDGK